jgi:hypothetical protein
MKKMPILIFNISYDTEGEEISDLPETLTMYCPLWTTAEEIADLASEFISDTTGFCHSGFEWKLNP